MPLILRTREHRAGDRRGAVTAVYRAAVTTAAKPTFAFVNGVALGGGLETGPALLVPQHR